MENSSNTPLNIHKVTCDTPGLLEKLLHIFVEVFPHDKRYVDYIRDCAYLPGQKTSLAIIHQWLFEYQGEFVGFRLFNYLRQRNFGFSRYVGLLPQYRDRGFGRMIHHLSAQQIYRDAETLGQPIPLGLCGELDHPDFTTNQQERQIRTTRLKIFRQWGNIILDDLVYFEPYMIQGRANDDSTKGIGVEPDRMLLYLFPIRPVTQLSPQMMTEVATGILLDNYRLSPDSWFVQKALASINQLNAKNNSIGEP